MIRQLFAILFLLFIQISFTQIDSRSWLEGKYNQDWYSFDVFEDGMYRITGAELDSFGIDISNLIGSNIQIFRGGQEIPIYTSTPGQISLLDYVEFYAFKEDGSLDKHLYADTTHFPHEKFGTYNDTAVYFLTWDDQTNHDRFIDQTNNLTNLPVKESYCYKKDEILYKSSFHQGQLRQVGQTNYSFCDYGKGEGLFGPNIFGTSSFTFRPINIDLANDSTYVEYQIIGTNDNEFVLTDHHYIFELGSFSEEGVIQDFSYTTNSVLVSTADLTEFNTVCTIENLRDLYDESTIAATYLNMRYPARLEADNAFSFDFSFRNFGQGHYFGIDEVNNNISDVYVYDKEGGYRMQGIFINDEWQFNLPALSSSSDFRDLKLYTDASIMEVTNFRKRRAVNYSDVANQGDFIVVVDEDLIPADSLWLKDYLNHRSTEYTPVVLNADDLFMHYSFGKKLHPMALVNLIDEAYDDWFYNVKYVFLIGQGMPYNTRTVYMQKCKIPSFGYQPSDILLSCDIGSIVPKISIGRIAANSSEEISDYISKVITHETQLNNYPNTKDGKEWMKKIIHLGGGSNEGEQNTFKRYLNEYADIVGQPNYGGHVTSFFKTSSDPIQTALSESFDTLVSRGISLITFFGHSSATTLEFGIYNPENYENEGKYPLVLSNGCLAGDIHRSGNTASKSYVLLKDKGAIGFVASIGVSYGDYDHIYSKEFYQQMTYKNYGGAIGDFMKETIINTNNVVTNENDQDLRKYTSQLITLHGDPSIKLNSHEKPDYVIETSDVYFDPANISIEQDSFDLVVIVTNIGKAVEDSFYLKVQRTFPDQGIETVYLNAHPSTNYKDTFIITLPTVRERALGFNEFEIIIDPTDLSESLQIDEIEDVQNNIIRLSTVILSDDIVPIHPYNNAIVNTSELTLSASTLNLFADQKQYRIQLDTSSKYNSPLLREFVTVSIGGLIQFDVPEGYLNNDQTYFWRSSVDTTDSPKFNWYESSFYYDVNSKMGWLQEDSAQFQKNELVNLGIGENGQLNFVDDVKDIRIFTYQLEATPTGYFHGDDMGYSINGVDEGRMRCFTQGLSSFKSGIVFAVFDSSTMEPWEKPMGEYGSLNCKRGRLVPVFEFDDSVLNDAVATANKRIAIENFIDTVPSGQYLLMYIVGGRGTVPQNWPVSLKNKINGFGATSFSTLQAKDSWAFFCKKDDNTFAVKEAVGYDDSSLVTLDVVISGSWTSGYMESELIGPSNGWDSIYFSSTTSDVLPVDDYSISVIGVDYKGNEKELIGVIESDTSLGDVSARDYPFIKLRWNVEDDSLRTPRQIVNWKVLFDQVPELALAPNKNFSFYSDTLEEGDSIQFEIQVNNVSETDFDSVRIKYSLLNSRNETSVLSELLIDSLKSKDSALIEFSYSTLNLSRGNRLILHANVDQDQSEEQSFNNIAVLPFYVHEDLSNPLLDVTFDGVHIIDGDYVASRPEVLIRLRDENKFVAMDDTSLINVFLQSPDGVISKVNFDAAEVLFIPPSDLNNNVAEIQYDPYLSEDGVYKLTIQGRDPSGNESGYFNYSVSFQVTQVSTITRVFNYPNPFTTSTRFVFELTGQEVPDYFKIQIMTIKGKVIRELTLENFEDMHIGRNISNFAWDGTDEFGDPVGNGVYLYRVYAKLNGEDILLNDKNVEQYFQSGIGKMTIIR